MVATMYSWPQGTAVIKKSVTMPAYISISNTQTALVLTEITFRFENKSNGSYKYDYLGDPLIEYSDDGTTWTPVPTSYNFGENLNINYTAASGPAEALYHGGKTITIRQSEHSVVHNYWRVLFQTKSISSNIEGLAVHITNIVWRNPNSTTIFEANTNFGIDDLDSLQWAQSGTVLYVTSGKNKQPMSISYNNGTFTVADFSPTVSGNSIWDTHGFPACVSVFQNRLCFAGFETFKGRIVASKFGDFNDYTIPSPIQATSPIIADSLQLKSRIDFLWSGDKALYALSAEGVSMIDAGGGVIATDQIEFQLRNREPAAGILPTVKDDIMVYVGRNLQKIMITDFDFVVQRYKAVVLSTGYDDTLQSGIKAIHYIPTKARLIYGLLNDGKGFMLLFDSALQKNAIYPYSMEGNMTDILPVKQGDITKLLTVASYNSVWGILQKDAQPNLSIMDFMSEEEQKDYTATFLKNNMYLDYYTICDSDTQITWCPAPEVFSEEDSVEVLVDGVYDGKHYLISKTLHLLQSPNYATKYYVENIADGEPAWVQNTETGLWNCYGVLTINGATMSINSIEVEDQEETLDILACEVLYPAKRIVIGFPYESYAAIKLVTPYMIRKFPREIAVNFINTAHLELGNTFNDLQPVLGNIAENITLDNRPILLNGNYEKTLDKQAFETPYIIVYNNKGLPFTITGIDYEVDYSNYQGGV